MKIPIANILIGDRQRIDIGDPLNDLASIGDTEVGLINPITLEELQTPVPRAAGANPEDGYAFYHFKLLAGRRRLEWHIRSGKTEIEATVRGAMTEIQRQKVELLEDIERKDRTWQEECLAFYNVHNLIRREKAAQSQSWSVRAMAKFTKTDKNIIHYSLEIGSRLVATPRDEELWSCSTFSDAMKLIVERNYKAANDELEVRRKAWQQKEVLAREVSEPATDSTGVFEEEPTPDFVDAYEDSPAGAVSNEDTTPRKTKVFIHGLNIAFEDAKVGIHFMQDMSQTILVWRNKDEITENVWRALHPKGTVIGFESTGISWMDEHLEIRGQADPIIWNRIALGTEETLFPFVKNYCFGYIYYKTMPTEVNPNPSGSVISCLPDGDDLPYAVVEWCLKAIARPESAVLLPCNAPVLSVAMAGYTPVWFEKDTTKFHEKVQALKNYYLDTVPNAEIYLRKVDETGDWTSEALP